MRALTEPRWGGRVALIYIASKFGRRDFIKKTWMPRVEEMGHTVVSRWLDVPDGSPSVPRSREEGEDEALKDLSDVLLCDVLIMDDDHDEHCRGAYVEMGYARGVGKKTVYIGEPKTVLAYAATVIVPSWDEALEYLEGIG